MHSLYSVSMKSLLVNHHQLNNMERFLVTRAKACHEAQKLHQAREHLCCVHSSELRTLKPTSTIVVEKCSASHATSSLIIPGSLSLGNTLTWINTKTRRQTSHQLRSKSNRGSTMKSVINHHTEAELEKKSLQLILVKKLPHIYCIIF